MHYIQQYILDKLVFSKFLRNRDMRPPRVESNLYQYHLKELQKDGYIKKIDGLYTLSKKGLKYAGSHSTTLKKPRQQPTVLAVTFIEDPSGNVLVRTKQRQPFIGMQSLFMGKMHLDETVVDTARREFVEKTGGAADGLCFEQFATAHIVIKQEDCIISDFIGLLVLVQVAADTPTGPDATFTNPASDIPNLSPGIRQLLDMYTNGDSFGEYTIEMQ